ncbi:hypothetical protein ILUMI_26297 [Ignelater luminosus]|uniref:Negative elongation factor B n=1 Tax=Ignelater luminosus TaxID=2038154 RepID=A0A8K0FXF5_IGNLU|nr:hypothetical protein ILUMI_26297 [Ignelater luminosus]
MSSRSESEFPLEAAGIGGPNYLQDILKNCTDPLTAIEEFQSANGIHLSSLQPILPLLDLHGIPRLDFHNSVVEQLREKLTNHITQIAKSKEREKDRRLKELLAKTFPLVKVKALRPVVMRILKNMPEIDDKYLKVLLMDKELYKDTDIEVKRQIWKTNQPLFGDEVSSLVTEYIKEKENTLHDHQNIDVQTHFFYATPKVRRQKEVIQKLSELIGDNIKLYDTFLQFLRTLFCRTHNAHYCTLRADLLMTIHDCDVRSIITIDPCHKFTWCLDACIQDGKISNSKLTILQKFLNSIKKEQRQILGDISMALCDPYAINLIAISILTTLKKLIEHEQMPRDSKVLIFLLRMLIIGLNSWKIIEAQDFKEPKLDSQIVTKFMPALMALMVDDQIRQISATLPPDEHDAAIATIEHSGPVPDAVESYIQESSVASVVVIYYTLYVAKEKDRIGLLRILSILANCRDDIAFEDTFLHLLVTYLIHMAKEFSSEDFCTALFDEFLFAGITRESVMKHILKLLWHVYPYLRSNRLYALIKTLQPMRHHSEDLHNLYKSLCDRIKSKQEVEMPLRMDIDFESPFHGLPMIESFYNAL